MTDDVGADLYEITQRWSERIYKGVLPEILNDHLPRSSYQGNNPYNGFSGAERRVEEQVLQVLRRRGFIDKPEECDLCGSNIRIGFHAEDYFDPFSLVRVCFPCHMAVHARFKLASKWLDRLNANADRPLIADFRALPMQQVDFAGWLRANARGPHDVVKRIWPQKKVLDYAPRLKPISDEADRYSIAIHAAKPTETEWKLLDILERNPGLTSTELSGKMGWAGAGSWHMKFGQLCARLEPFLETAPIAENRRQHDGSPAKFYSGLIAEFDDVTRGFRMKPVVVEALRAMIR